MYIVGNYYKIRHMKSLKNLIIAILLISSLYAFGKQPSNIINPILDTFSRQIHHIYIPNQNNYTQQLLSDKKTTKKLIKICKNRVYPIKKIYIEFTNLPEQQTAIANFIQILNKENISVYFLFNNSMQITNPEYFNNIVSDIVKYNTQNPENVFDGIHFNLKPYIHPAWTSTPEKLITYLIKILANSKKQIIKANTSLELGISIPYTYGYSATREQKFIHQIFNYVNFVNISPLSNDYLESIKNIENIAKYAEETKTAFNLNIMIQPIPNKKITYFEANPTNIKKSLKHLKNELKQYPHFSTLAFDDFYQFENLISQIKFIAQAKKELPINSISISTNTIEFKTSANNIEKAITTIKQDNKNIYFSILVNDKNYISTNKGIRDNKITDDHIEIHINSDAILGSLQRNALEFKLSAGSDKQTPYTTPIQPATSVFNDNWKLTTVPYSNGYILELIIPKKELFFDNFNNNYFRFNIIVFNTNSIKKHLEKKYTLTENIKDYPLIHITK